LLEAVNICLRTGLGSRYKFGIFERPHMLANSLRWFGIWIRLHKTVHTPTARTTSVTAYAVAFGLGTAMNSSEGIGTQ